MAKIALFHVSPTSGLPLFRQIIDQVHALIATGKLQPGDMLPSVRELSKSLEVNMMTISKAYSRLEADGILVRVRGRGMAVGESPTAMSLDQRKAEFTAQVEPALHRARQLALTEDQILRIINKILKEHQS